MRSAKEAPTPGRVSKSLRSALLIFIFEFLELLFVVSTILLPFSDDMYSTSSLSFIFGI